MIDWLIWVVLGVLVLASFLDLKYKAVPSVLLTGMIFAVLLLRPDNLLFGVIAGVFAWIIRDLISDVAEMEFGMADIKIMIIIGLLLANFTSLMIMIGAFSIFQFAYTVIWRWKVAKDGEMPFIPCLLAVYISLILVGGVA
jgi:hypothetical protein